MKISTLYPWWNLYFWWQRLICWNDVGFSTAISILMEASSWWKKYIFEKLDFCNIKPQMQEKASQQSMVQEGKNKEKMTTRGLKHNSSGWTLFLTSCQQSLEGETVEGPSLGNQDICLLYYTINLAMISSPTVSFHMPEHQRDSLVMSLKRGARTESCTELLHH